jgi:methionine-rich copper-binding protein CopC
VGSAGSAVVSVVWLRLGSRFVNRATAVIVLSSGVRVTLVQKMVILQCRAPAAFCQRVSNPRQLRCTANTPLSGRRASVTVTGGAGQRATGAANVSRGRYTVIVRSSTPLAAGVYAYKAVVRSSLRGVRFQSLRRVTVR